MPVSAIWAEAGKYVIEFHYGIEEPARSKEDPLYYTGFWGKIKKSYLENQNSITVTIQFRDGSCGWQKVRNLADISPEKLPM